MADAVPLEDDAWWAAQTSTDGPHAGKAWWGWGLASELRAEVATRLAEAGVADRSLRLLRPPTVEDAARRLPPPRITAASLPAELQCLCTAAPFERLLHMRGRDMVDVIRNVLGDVSEAHDLVVYPETETHVQALLVECRSRNIAVVPFGGGSSVVGGVAPPPTAKDFSGCIAMDLAKMDRVLEVDASSQCARVQGGIYGPALETALKPSGLTLRHFPQSFEFSTLGGWIATRGGGHYATGLTHIDDMVQSVRVVCPTGATETRQLPASGAGPAEHRLYVGSEGCLGVITEAWLRLRPRPATRASATVAFAGTDADAAFESGARALRSMVQTGLAPANLRLVYGPEVARAGGAGLGEAERGMLASAAILLIGFESPVGGPDGAAVLNAQMSLLLGVAVSDAHRGVVLSKRPAGEGDTLGGEREGIAGSWGKGFMRGGYTSSASCLLPSMIVNTIETACTWAAFPALHSAVLRAARDAVRRECGVEGQVTCRITHVYPDGPAPYYTIVVQGMPEEGAADGMEDPRIRMWLAIKRDVMGAIIERGGTSTHHHAVGRLHQEHYEEESGALWRASLAASKAVHDPTGIMSPGMLVGSVAAKL
mmetsp:Transcript_11189/g.35480  ORF Transcript_11189/g.35480 Transcript_11189/m.35480 type:complete len:598 (-) Transcript_11189:98-1891(-)